jgi:polyhydroxyalkanoate synthase
VRQDTPEFWAQAAQQFQQAWSDAWRQYQVQAQATAPGPAFSGLPAIPELMVSVPPDKLQALQQQYLQDMTALLQGTGPAVGSDRRFAAPAWAENPYAAQAASTYLLNARFLMQLADAVQADAKTRARIRFAV